jgi:hypothetical protein
VKRCLFMEKSLFGLKSLELRRSVFEFTVRKNILHSFIDAIADTDLYQVFIRRYPEVSLRASE